MLDSNLIRSPEGAPKAAMQQKEWLEKTLTDAKSNPNRQIVVFQHIPYFVKSPDEPVGYFNIPEPIRQEYLHLLKQAGVQYVFAGHLHKPSIAEDGSLTAVVTGAVGKPLGGSLSGFRIVAVEGRKLDPAWFCFGGIPNQVDPQKPASTPCPQ